MTTSKVSNEMIYELLKAQDRRMDDMARRLDLIDKRLDRLEDKYERIDQRLHNIEDQINGIRMTWSTRLVSTILGTSAVTSAIVAYFITSIS